MRLQMAVDELRGLGGFQHVAPNEAVDVRDLLDADGLIKHLERALARDAKPVAEGLLISRKRVERLEAARPKRLLQLAGLA